MSYDLKSNFSPYIQNRSFHNRALQEVFLLKFTDLAKNKFFGGKCLT